MDTKVLNRALYTNYIAYCLYPISSCQRLIDEFNASHFGKNSKHCNICTDEIRDRIIVALLTHNRQ